MPRRERPVRRVATRALLVALGAYRLLLRPLLPPSCRFAPTCSEYAREAIAQHGASTGLRLALRRVLRCHPWQPGGADPVPARGG